jgi:putative phosphoribosyl transferase
MLFRDRNDAGRRLAAALAHYTDDPGVLVLALPRGGVPIAFQVALALHAPLDIFLVRKLGVPGQPELAMGAVATGGVRVLNRDVLRQLDISAETIEHIAALEQQEIERRDRLYREGRPAPQVNGKIVILVDDGLATGSTMRAAALALKPQSPGRIVVAVPVASPCTCDELSGEVDEIVCLQTPQPFYAVGEWYEDFSQTSDLEVHDLLARASHFPSSLAS